MGKLKLVYVWSLRNAAADSAGRYVPYKGEHRYMASPLQYLVNQLNSTELGDVFSLEAIINDDDEGSDIDRRKLESYGFSYQPGKSWFFPPDLAVAERPVTDLLQSVPSSYRRLPVGSPERTRGKQAFERQLAQAFDHCQADFVVLDGLLVILDQLARPDSPYHRRIVNIHPGITRSDSPYVRRGAYATLDALHGARGERVVDWESKRIERIPAIDMTGASFHYIDQGIDSGEVIADVLNTKVSADDTILELRWNNFNNSLFPALRDGLLTLAGRRAAER